MKEGTRRKISCPYIRKLAGNKLHENTRTQLDTIYVYTTRIAILVTLLTPTLLGLDFTNALEGRSFSFLP